MDAPSFTCRGGLTAHRTPGGAQAPEHPGVGGGQSRPWLPTLPQTHCSLRAWGLGSCGVASTCPTTGYISPERPRSLVSNERSHREKTTLLSDIRDKGFLGAQACKGGSETGAWAKHSL